MSNFAIRVASVEDQAAVHDVCLWALLPVDMEDHAGLERLLWRTAGIVGLVAEWEGSVVGAGFGTVTKKADETISGAITILAVDPDRSRRSVGAALLTALEQELRELGASEIWTGGGQPRFWWPGVDESCAGTIRFFERAGYVRDDDAVNMRVVLSDADLAARAPCALTIHRLSASEWPAFSEWMERTWEDPWGAEVQTTMDRSPVSCFVAERDRSYVGFAAYDTNRRSWFGPMGSSPEARDRGSVGSCCATACVIMSIRVG